MDYYKCKNCGKRFDEFEMNFRLAQIDKKCWCEACREAAQQSVHPTVFTVATPESAVHEFCVAATIAMVAAGITKHVSFVHPEDLGAKPTFRMKAGGRIPKITIEWVHASEAEAER